MLHQPEINGSLPNRCHLVTEKDGKLALAADQSGPKQVATFTCADETVKMPFTTENVRSIELKELMTSKEGHGAGMAAVTVDGLEIGYVDIARVMQEMEDKKDVVPDLDFYICNTCNRTFKQKARYERHIANHPTEKKFVCETCNKSFQRVSHLEKHIRTHTNERSHICDICGAAFILSHHLKRHYLLHSGVRPFGCDICGKQFTRKAGLTQHLVVHTGSRPFQCQIPECDKQFADRTTLRRHMLTHSREKPFICKECNKTFRTKSACRKHYLRHFKDELVFKCSICEEMFHSEEQLHTHSVIHEAKQRTCTYRCGFCLRVFKKQEDLDAHVNIHESGLSFSCDRCTAKFYTSNDLASHIEKHNRGSFDPKVSSGTMIERVTISTDVTNTSNIALASTVSSDQQVVFPSSPVRLPKASPANLGKKVLVVLQLPQAIADVKMEQQQSSDMQHLLVDSQVDKLLVPVTHGLEVGAYSLLRAPAISVQLSPDQQHGINQILQTTDISSQIVSRLSRGEASIAEDSHMRCAKPRTLDEKSLIRSIISSVEEQVSSAGHYITTQLASQTDTMTTHSDHELFICDGEPITNQSFHVPEINLEEEYRGNLSADVLNKDSNVEPSDLENSEENFDSTYTLESSNSSNRRQLNSEAVSPSHVRNVDEPDRPDEFFMQGDEQVVVETGSGEVHVLHIDKDAALMFPDGVAMVSDTFSTVLDLDNIPDTRSTNTTATDDGEVSL